MDKNELKNLVLKYGFYYIIRDTLSSIPYVDYHTKNFDDREKNILEKVKNSEEITELSEEELIALKDTNFVAKIFENIIFDHFNFIRIINIPKNIENIVEIKGNNLIGVFDYQGNLIDLFIIARKSGFIYNENEVFKNLIFQPFYYFVPLDYYLGALLVSETNLLEKINDVQKFLNDFLKEFRDSGVFLLKGQISEKINISAKEKVFKLFLQDNLDLIEMSNLMHLLFVFEEAPVIRQQLLSSYFYLFFEILARRYGLSLLNYNDVKNRQRFIFNDVKIIKKFVKHVHVVYDDKETPIELRISNIVNKEPLKSKIIQSYVKEGWFKSQSFSYIQTIQQDTEDYFYYYRLSFEKNNPNSFYHIFDKNNPLNFILTLSQLRTYLEKILDKKGMSFQDFEELPLKDKFKIIKDKNFYKKYLIYKAFYKYINYLLVKSKEISIKLGNQTFLKYLRSLKFFVEFFRASIISLNNSFSKNVEIRREGSIAEAKIYHDFIEIMIPYRITKEPIFEKLKVYFDVKIINDKQVKITLNYDQLINYIVSDEELLNFFTPFLSSILDEYSFFDGFISKESYSNQIKNSLLATETRFNSNILSYLSVDDIFSLIRSYENFATQRNFSGVDEYKITAVLNYIKEHERDVIFEQLILKKEFSNKILDLFTGNLKLNKGNKTYSFYELYAEDSITALKTLFYSFEDFKDFTNEEEIEDFIEKEVEKLNKNKENTNKQFEEVI